MFYGVIYHEASVGQGHDPGRVDPLPSPPVIGWAIEPAEEPHGEHDETMRGTTTMAS